MTIDKHLRHPSTARHQPYPMRPESRRRGIEASARARRLTYIDSGAVIVAPQGSKATYRYRLWRTWDDSLPRVLWVMLNPSTADAHEDDPTIRRCVSFAWAWGYGAITVVNLYALRATYPNDMRVLAQANVDVVGPDNDTFIAAAARQAEEVVCGWGAHAGIEQRARHVLALLDDAWVVPMCLGVTKDGYPRHPLYVAATQPLEPYTTPRNVEMAR